MEITVYRLKCKHHKHIFKGSCACCFLCTAYPFDILQNTFFIRANVMFKINAEARCLKLDVQCVASSSATLILIIPYEAVIVFAESESLKPETNKRRGTLWNTNIYFMLTQVDASRKDLITSHFGSYSVSSIASYSNYVRIGLRMFQMLQNWQASRRRYWQCACQFRK